MPYGDPSPEACSPAQTRPETATGTHRAPLGLRHLPRAAADLILLGDLTARYSVGSYSRLGPDGRTLRLREDRQGAADHGHRITAAIACHVARAGGSVDQLMQLVMHPDHEGGRHVQNIALRSGHAQARTYLERVWASACETVSSTTPVESRHHAHEDLARLRDRIESTPWRGERHRTALRVLRAHLTFAQCAGGRQHAASERQVAEEAGDRPPDPAQRLQSRPEASGMASPTAHRSGQGGLHLVPRQRARHARRPERRFAVSYLDHSVPPPAGHLRSGPPMRQV